MQYLLPMILLPVVHSQVYHRSTLFQDSSKGLSNEMDLPFGDMYG
jgi:hypothetical protein